MIEVEALLNMTTAELVEYAFEQGHISFTELLDCAAHNADSTQDRPGEVCHIMDDGSTLIITAEKIVSAY